jgi:hypothetical protein
MITWQEVVDASAISGTPVGYSSGRTELSRAGHLGYLNTGYTEGSTYDWFGGVIANSFSFDQVAFGFLNEDFDDVSIDQNGTTWTFYFPKAGVTSNGGATNTFFSLTRIEPEIGFGSTGDPVTDSSSEPQDTNWSRSSVNLPSYVLTTLNNQAGTTTTQTASVELLPTTSLIEGETQTVNSQFAITRTTTSAINTSTVASWQVQTYDTFFLTGQTTAQLYSSFSHGIPAVYQSGAIATASKTVEPMSFVESDTYANTQNFTIKSTLQTFGNSAWTTTTAGASVTNSTNPQTAVGGSKLATSNALRIVKNTEQQNANEVYATVSQNAILGTTKQANIGNSTVAAAFGSTSSIGITSSGYETGGPIGTNATQTQSGEFFLDTTNGFATQRAAEVIAVHDVTVGVRANSSHAAGGGIEAIGAGQRFSFHTSSVVLPVSTTTQKEGSSFTFFLDSYTAKDSDGETTQSVFNTTGQAQQQWMTIAPTNSAANSASVLGGAIAGNAIVGNGNYRTFAAGGEGNSAVIEPLEVTWQAGAATTAWLPDFRVETVEATSPVVAISRHSFTQVIDD